MRLDLISDSTQTASSHPSHLSVSSGSTAMDTSGSCSLAPAPAWTWPFDEACAKLEPVFVQDLAHWPAGLEPRSWDNEKARHAVVIPVLAEAGQKVPTGILVVGVNTDRKSVV
mgnify:FL=1